MLPSQLVAEVEALRAEEFDIELVEAEGWALLVLHQYMLPSGYAQIATDLLLKFPLAYPNGQPDMFWVEEAVALVSNAVPRNADSVEVVLGRRWRRFSWHTQAWNPGVDCLRTYLGFVDAGLTKAKAA